jgi:hypothetical protein
MRDIHEVLRRKQAKYAQLGKEIEMLQQAADKLREVAPLLADNDDEDSAILLDADEPAHAAAPPKPAAAAAGASSTSQPVAKPASRNMSPRWP